MRAVLLDVPAELLADRRRMGLDIRDEMWECVLHMVPSPTTDHQGLGSRLLLVLATLAEAKGLRHFYETAVYDPAAPPETNYRVPDQVYASPEYVSHRGIEGRAALVVELLSPHDETYDKLAFYASVGVEEVLIIDPITRAVEMWRPVIEAGVVPKMADAPKMASAPEMGRSEPVGGNVEVRALGVTLERVEGPRLRLTYPGGVTEI